MTTAFVLSGGASLGAIQVGMLLGLARAGITPLKALKRTRSILFRAHARILGVVLNDSSVGQDTGYYGKNSYGYYE